MGKQGAAAHYVDTSSHILRYHHTSWHIDMIRTSWLKLVHPGACRTGDEPDTPGRTGRTDPGLLTGRWEGGSETPQKFTIKLDRAHDREGLQRVTVQLCISHSS